jgi:hypothetical protein
VTKTLQRYRHYGSVSSTKVKSTWAPKPWVTIIVTATTAVALTTAANTHSQCSAGRPYHYLYLLLVIKCWGGCADVCRVSLFSSVFGVSTDRLRQSRLDGSFRVHPAFVELKSAAAM